MVRVLPNAIVRHGLRLGGGRVASAFSLPNLLASYDVDTEALADNAAITGLTDLSGNGRHIVQATAARRPTNKTNILGGRAVARFDGTTDVLQTPSIDLSAFTALTEYVVGKCTAGDGGALVEFSANPAANPGSWSLSPVGATNQLTSRLQGNVGNNSHSSARSWNAYSIIEHVMDFGAISKQENSPWVGGARSPQSEPLTSDNTGAFGNHPLNFGARDGGTGSAELLGMDLAAYLLYGGAHTATQRHQVVRYLSTRFGFDFYEVNVVYDGDSLTFGAESTLGNSYPDQVATVLTTPLSWSNWGIPSQTIATMLANGAAKIDPQRSGEVPTNVCVLWGGTNDLLSVAAATVYADIVAYAQARRAAGWQVIVLTILPRTGAPGGFSAARASVNASIRANTTDFDAVADPATDPRIGDDGDDANGTYYADGVHLTDAGYAIVAGTVVSALARLGVGGVTADAITHGNEPVTHGGDYVVH